MPNDVLAVVMRVICNTHISLFLSQDVFVIKCVHYEVLSVILRKHFFVVYRM